jgi:AraC-like DNA-binding protein
MDPSLPLIISAVLEKSDTPHREVEGWYREVPPPPALAAWVLSLWEMRIPNLGLPARVRIVPNASVDIVIYASAPSEGEGPAAIVAPPHRSYVVGSTLRSFIVRSAGWRHVIGASLLPAGVQPILGMPARVIGESIVLLHDIIGNQAGAFEERVIDGDPARALERMAHAIAGLRGTLPAPNELVHRAVGLVRTTRGTKRIEAVAADMNVSTRRLERQFLEQIGLTPKTFSRLVRFDRTVRALATRGATPWSQFALTHGYTDQAHFINEFKEFAGVTPVEFEAEQA